MKILFAAPDRDLLECYKKLLAPEFGETVTTFDGTHVLSLLATETFDIAVLDEKIPRIGFETLLSRMRDNKLPVIGLINGPVSVDRLTAAVIPCAFLSYPFDADEMVKVIKDTAEKAGSGEMPDVRGTVIDVGDFRIKDGPYLTSGEIDVLKHLLDGDKVTDAEGAYISAINRKLADTGSGTAIRYRPKKGFELVAADE